MLALFRGGIKFEIKGAIFGFCFSGAFEGAIFCPKFSLLRSKFKIFSIFTGEGGHKVKASGGIEHPYAPLCTPLVVPLIELYHAVE